MIDSHIIRIRISVQAWNSGVRACVATNRISSMHTHTLAS